MLLTLAEAAQRLGMSTRQLRYRIQEGKIPAKRVGDRWTLDSDQLPKGGARSRDRAETRQAAVASALAPHVRKEKRYTVMDLPAFQGTLACYAAVTARFGESHTAARALARLPGQGHPTRM